MDRKLRLISNVASAEELLKGSPAIIIPFRQLSSVQAVAKEDSAHPMEIIEYLRKQLSCCE